MLYSELYEIIKKGGKGGNFLKMTNCEICFRAKAIRTWLFLEVCKDCWERCMSKHEKQGKIKQTHHQNTLTNIPERREQ